MRRAPRASELAGRQGWRFVAILLGVLVVGAFLLGLGTIALRQVRAHRGAAPSGTVESAAPRSVPITERLAQTPVKIAERVYLLGNVWPSAVYIVDTSEGLAMIDSGLESAHPIVLRGMSSLGLDVGRLKMILLTHAHGDHTLGAQRLRDLTGARIYIGGEDAEMLRRGGPWEAFFAQFDMQGETLHPTTVDGELVDDQVLVLGEARFTVLATPGHTPGSCCFLLDLDGQRLLFTGDVITTFHVGTGTYSAALSPRYRGDAVRYLQSLKRLRRLPLPDFVLPGHPGSEPVPVDPKLDVAQWHALVDQGIVELEDLGERFSRDGADFLDGNPKEIVEGVYYLGDFSGRAAYAFISQSQALVFDGARGLDAARRLNAAWHALGVRAPAISAVLLTSCEAENLAGLESLVRESNCKVVAPDEGRDAVARCCPDGASVVSAAQLSALGWDELGVISIAGVGDPEAAYYFRRAEATVLVSGPNPIDADEREFAKLARQGPPIDWDGQLAAESLNRLGEITPHVWLSAVPWRGRNANLYNGAWEYALESNRELIRRWEAWRRPQRRR